MNPASSTTQNISTRLAFAIGALACLAFGLMTLHHVATLRAGEPAIWARLLSALVTDQYALGQGSAQLLQEAAGRPYQIALTAMSWHLAMGGSLLILGLLQFMPALRRRWPRLHRATGAVFIATCVASMGSAIWYLAHTAPEDVFSGPAFSIGLAANAASVLSTLALAVFAIRARDYRSHMGWMALTYGSILSAPVLRLGYWLVGSLFPVTMVEANLGIAETLIGYCVLPMAIWMARVGAQEFPPRAAAASLPAPLLRALSVLAAALAIHEGVLVSFGFDLLGALRPPTWVLPPAAALWGIAAAISALAVPRALRAAERGEKLPAAALVAALLTAAGAGLVAALHHPRGAVTDVAQPLFWGGYAVYLLLLSALAARARPAANGREPWAIQLQCALLLPAMWALLGLPLMACGVGFAAAMSAATGVGTGGVTILGFALGFGLALHLPMTLGRRLVLSPSQGANSQSRDADRA